jgi:sulfite reductase (NADPH) flavoprotein alpha-component
MSGFNYLMLGLAAFAALLFILLLVVLVRRTRGRGGFEPPDPRPVPPPVVPVEVAPRPVAITAPAPPYAAWRLISRDVANPASAGGPLFRLRIVPLEGPPMWRAGAIARVYCGPAGDVLDADGVATAPSGDYMIGSVPDDGAIDLVIRVRDNPSPEEGYRSNWLCCGIEPGADVAIALRDNPDFAPPPDALPLILIGNATGLAGLHAHIRARPAGTRNWLIFGDRNSAHDKVLAAEIADWVSTGHLERCDLVFPGEGEERRHVTDQIRDASEPLLDWALAGAAIYVCGSMRMGNDVHMTLAGLLGEEVLDAMADEGLYRRSLY